MVDDKLRILRAMKNAWGDRLTTVLRARSQVTANYPPAGLTIGCIGDLLNYDLSTLLGASEDRRATLFSDA